MAPENYRVGLAQVNSCVGDLAGNSRKVEEYLRHAKAAGCGLVAFPELVLTGYPPEDLLLLEDFLARTAETVAQLVPTTVGITALVGYAERKHGKLYNSLALLSDGSWVGNYQKQQLPNYDVFDERRYFEAGRTLRVYEQDSLRFAVAICEDLWRPSNALKKLLASGVQLCVSSNASPYCVGRPQQRLQMLQARAAEASCTFAYVNAVGGQDELIFDGGSVVLAPDGSVLAQAPQFEEALLTFDLVQLPPPNAETRPKTYRIETLPATFKNIPPQTALRAPQLTDEAQVWGALVLGVRDYLAKTGFTDVLIGLSGGVDSALVAAVAVDALGADQVTGVAMPSRYSSEHSVQDARLLAENLGITLLEIPIEPTHAAMLDMLKDTPLQHTKAEENLQARARGNILMTLSNARGALVLSTGNKSEMAVGFATLYGDMVGGFAVIKDVPKLLVYRLCRWKNKEVGTWYIPQSTLEKPPSAELAPNQVDLDALPPYEILDPLLEAYVEQNRSREQLIAAGFAPSIVAKVTTLVDQSEYKRRQAPPGVRISAKAFGKDRRYPIAQRWRG